ncbi:MAG: hypothetical protein MMC23_003534 [Stictis urceolatum]|nr:hypothetical protein [Stictis urceolata]
MVDECADSNLADRSVNAQVISTPSDSASLGTHGTSNVVQMQVDLMEAQKARGDLSKRLTDVNEELQRLQVTSKDEGRRIAQLNSEKNALAIRLRDRDEELRTKKKLLDDVHDETIALTLQLNVKDEQNQKLKQENQELVDRWMARMGKEAEEMNTVSKFS